MFLSVFVLLLSSGCHHDIRFEDIGYSIGQKKSNAGLVAAITPQTLAQGKQIHSIMTGAVHTWEARPGEMLRQIAEVEFLQMFQYYRPAIEYHICLVLLCNSSRERKDHNVFLYNQI
jgi:hypothetical protein